MNGATRIPTNGTEISMGMGNNGPLLSFTLGPERDEIDESPNPG
jgi:hypothetical protein